MLEGALRLHFHIQDPIIQSKKTSTLPDPILGWDVRPNLEYKIKDSGFYKVDVQGFRSSPKKHDPLKKTILLIGDSFTHAPNISNENLYYAPLSKGNYNFYAYGMTGWGNIQEVLKVKSLLSKIKPDLVIWQLSSNDLIENILEIEVRLGKISSNRPYLSKEKKVFYDHEVRFISKILYVLQPSRAASFIFNRFFSLTSSRSKKINLENSEIEKAKLITSLIIKKMKEILPKDTELISFNAGPLPFENKLIKKIAISEGLIHISEIEDTLTTAKSDKLKIFNDDNFHWNIKGHAMIGEILRKRMTKLLESDKKQ